MSGPQYPQPPQNPSQPPYSSPPQYAPPGVPPARRKGLPVWAWILIALGGTFTIVIGLLVAGGIFVARKVQQAGANPIAAMARLAAAANPDIEVLDVDEKTGKVTVKDRKSGKTVTIDADRLKEGKLEITTDEGRATFGSGANIKYPGWVPLPPGGKVMGGMTSATNEANGGTLVVETSEDMDKVAAFYEEKCADLGLKIKNNASSNSEGKRVVSVHAESEDGRRSLVISLTAGEGKVAGTVVYADKP